MYVAPDQGTTHVPPGHDAGSDDAGNDDAGSDDAGNADSGAIMGSGGGVGSGDGTFGGPAYLLALIGQTASLGVAPATDPQQYTGVISSPSNKHFALRNGSLLYGDSESPVYRFVSDINGSPPPATFVPPASPTSNDVIVDTTPCPGGPSAFATGPNGRFVYQCAGGPWYEDAKVIFTPKNATYLIAIGSADLALAQQESGFGALSLQDATFTPIAAYDDLPLAIRAAGDGFDMVRSVSIAVAPGYATELDHVDGKGVLTSTGQYPYLPDGYDEGSAAFATDNSIFQVARMNETAVIFERSLTGTPTVVYTQEVNSNLVLGQTTWNGLLINSP